MLPDVVVTSLLNMHRKPSLTGAYRNGLIRAGQAGALIENVHCAAH